MGNRDDSDCASCGAPQMARNNYFTGKMLVERDFVDEQRYFLDKHTRHNRLLHGWGTVCGLEVEQHPDPRCRDRFVIVRPGYALDCCGNEILVERTEQIDFHALVEEALAQMDPEARDRPWAVQIRVCHQVCPAEQVPVLFDECAQDACAPNRIVEGYRFEAHLVPPRREDVRSEVSRAGDRGASPPQLSSRRLIEVEGISSVTGDAETGQIWVSAGNELSLRDRAGSPLETLAVDGGGTVVRTADGAHVLLVTPEGMHVIDSALEGERLERAGGHAVSISRDGAVAVAHRDESRLLVWDTAPVDPDDVDGLPTHSKQLQIPPESVVFNGSELNVGFVGAVGVFNFDTAEERVVELDAAHRPRLFVFDDVVHYHDRNEIWRVGAVAERVAVLPSNIQDCATVDGVLYAAVPGEYVYRVDPSTGAFVEDTRIEDPGTAKLATDGVRLFLLTRGHLTIIVPYREEEEDARDCFEPLVRPCPECPDDPCVPLAQFDYALDEVVEDADIDNTRRRLPSVQRLFEIVQCLASQRAARAPDAEELPDRVRTTPETRLTHICAISWSHGLKARVGDHLVIAFDGPIDFAPLSFLAEHVVRLQRQVRGPDETLQWGDVRAVVRAITLDPPCVIPDQRDIDELLRADQASDPNAIVITNITLEQAPLEARQTYRVVLHGDHLPDANGRSVDANNTAPWTGTTDDPDRRSGNGTPGGTFMSWFRTPGEE